VYECRFLFLIAATTAVCGLSMMHVHVYEQHDVAIARLW